LEVTFTDGIAGFLATTGLSGGNFERGLVEPVTVAASPTVGITSSEGAVDVEGTTADWMPGGVLSIGFETAGGGTSVSSERTAEAAARSPNRRVGSLMIKDIATMTAARATE
jgi:hypothetical protein